MLTDEQTQNIKTHLLDQLENFPEDQRKIIKHKILSMNNEEMETFLKENNLNTSKEEKQETQKCIFCAIAKKEIKAYILDENTEYIAILELNPLSKGHTLIIPKEHYLIDKLPESSIEFAKNISSNISSKLKPKDIQFQKNEVLGHANLEVIPIYDDSKLERKRASEEELKELFNLLHEEIKVPEKKTQPEEKKEISEKPQESKQEEPKIELPKIKPRLKWI
jgi:histidine triad (HIT) family protein